jgi:hypothetical protein
MVDGSQFAYYKTRRLPIGSGGVDCCIATISRFSPNDLQLASITIVKQALRAVKEPGPPSWRGRRYKIFAPSWIDAFTLASTEAMDPFGEGPDGFDLVEQQTLADHLSLFAPAFRIRRAAATNGHDN